VLLSESRHATARPQTAVGGACATHQRFSLVEQMDAAVRWQTDHGGGDMVLSVPYSLR
jgi:hypothetical protein